MSYCLPQSPITIERSCDEQGTNSANTDTLLHPNDPNAYKLRRLDVVISTSSYRAASQIQHHILRWSWGTISPRGPAGETDMASSAMVKLQISPARSRLAQDELSGRVRGWKRACEAGCMLCIRMTLSSGVELRYMNASRSNSCGDKLLWQGKSKEKFTLFSDHNGSLLRRQPGGKLV